MIENQLISLIIRHLSGDLTKGKARQLKQWVDANPENQLLLQRLSDESELEKELDRWRSINVAEAHAKLVSFKQAHRRATVRRILRWSVAASLLIAVMVVSLNKKLVSVNSSTPPAVGMTTQPVLPGRNTATLTLSNGQQILLDSAISGSQVMQGNTRLTKTDDKSISYASVNNRKPEGVLYNILTTPRSGQYQVILPDGTHVWLNNVSTLRYPTSFSGKNRTVELSGEAYFEIAKDVVRPFFVKVKNETVEVLGTSFNIMAYEEEGNSQTTLLNGAVRVSAGNAVVQLNPDEQAQVTRDGLKVLKKVPSQEIISWKNGFFYFGRASLKEVMRQLARWYDVDVVYQGSVPDVEFGGKIDRSLPLNELLNFLDKNQVHFRLEGRKIIVLP